MSKASEPAQLPEAVEYPIPPALEAALGPGWVAHELAGVSFGDKRLVRRSYQILDSFFAQPAASIPQACGSVAAAKATYNFFDNFSVYSEEILNSHAKQTLERMRSAGVVLAVNDTTTISHERHPTLQGMGPVNREADHAQGYFLHATLAVTTQGVPLGILQALVWAREAEEAGSAKRRRKRPIEEKESYKWLESYQACQAVQAQLPETCLVQVGDRESDIYELFELAAATPAGPHLLIRAEQDRNLLADGGLHLWDCLGQQAIAGTITVDVTARPKRPARQAVVAVRFAAVHLRPPRNGKETHPRLPISLWAVWAEEQQPPPGVEPISWMLLTTLPVTSFEQAVEKIQWYCLRWEIEVFHKVIKSGCRVEERRLNDFVKHKRCLAFDLLVAWRIQLLTKLNRETPQLPALTVFSQEEVEALYAVDQQQAIPPPPDLTLGEAIRMVAKLGGFLGRKGDGHPGTVTIWRGLQRLKDITFGWRLARAGLPPP